MNFIELNKHGKRTTITMKNNVWSIGKHGVQKIMRVTGKKGELEQKFADEYGKAQDVKPNICKIGRSSVQKYGVIRKKKSNQKYPHLPLHL